MYSQDKMEMLQGKFELTSVNKGQPISLDFSSSIFVERGKVWSWRNSIILSGWKSPVAPLLPKRGGQKLSAV